MDKKKILAIDDDVDMLRMLKSTFEATGDYEVTCLRDAKEIISTVHVFQPNLILLDLIMSNTGGLEVCEMLNQDSVGVGVPIIIFSALGKEIDKVKAFKLGVVDYLVKPINVDELRCAVEKAVRTKSEEH